MSDYGANGRARRTASRGPSTRTLRTVAQQPVVQCMLRQNPLPATEFGGSPNHQKPVRNASRRDCERRIPGGILVHSGNTIAPRGASRSLKRYMTLHALDLRPVDLVHVREHPAAILDGMFL